MPGDRDDEICQKALELLSDLCSKGEVQNKHCLDFIYYFRDLARPRYSDSGESDDYLFIYLFTWFNAAFNERRMWLLVTAPKTP